MAIIVEATGAVLPNATNFSLDLKLSVNMRLLIETPSVGTYVPESSLNVSFLPFTLSPKSGGKRNGRGPTHQQQQSCFLQGGNTLAAGGEKKRAGERGGVGVGSVLGRQAVTGQKQ